jgi:hypothetical protein
VPGTHKLSTVRDNVQPVTKGCGIILKDGDLFITKNLLSNWHPQYAHIFCLPCRIKNIACMVSIVVLAMERREKEIEECWKKE